MSFLWFIVGGAVVALYFWFRNTKTAVQEAANREVAEFIQAIQRWNAEESNTEEAFALALHHVAVYLQRHNDLRDPTGRSLPAHRAVLAQSWPQALATAGLLTTEGDRPRWDMEATEFWEKVDWFVDGMVKEAVKERLLG